MRLILSNRFVQQHQDLFASLSGDKNEIHMSQSSARRSMFGSQIVHGIHTLLWALESFYSWSKLTASPPAEIVADFMRPLFLGELASVYCIESEEHQGVVLIVRVEKKIVLKLSLTNVSCADYKKGPSKSTSVIGEGEISTSYGQLQRFRTEFSSNEGEFARHFPNVSRALSPGLVRLIASTSTLVGMQYPGRYSLFSSLNIQWTGKNVGENLQSYLENVDSRFSLSTLKFCSGDAFGTITAFTAPKPIRQASLSEIKRKVPPECFRSKHALVVGGSRGLGELAAKIFAAGGGEVTITYNVGKNDATAISDEIKVLGGVAEVMHFDVLSNQTPTISKEQAQAFTHLYYFATSPIGKNKISEFDSQQLDLYIKFYVTGFSRLLKFLHDSGNRNLKILYPSTIFLSEPKTNVSEYIVAKGASEFLCILIPQIFPGFNCTFPRLDKSATDQNISLTPLPVSDALEILLPHMLKEY